MTDRRPTIARRPRPSDGRRGGLATLSAADCKECPRNAHLPAVQPPFAGGARLRRYEPMGLLRGRSIVGLCGPSHCGTRFASDRTGALRLVVGARLIILVDAAKR